MTKAEYISYIKNLLPKVDQTNKYHDNVIAMAISTAHEQLFNELYRRGEKNLDQYAIKYVMASRPASGSPQESNWTYYEFDEASHFDGIHPVNIDSLSRGVRRIISQQSPSLKFRPVTHQGYEQMDSDELDYLVDVVWYYVDAERIMFKNGTLFTSTSTTNLVVYMIPRFYDIASTETFNIPRGHGHRLMKYTLEALGVIPPKDLIADNSDQ